MPLETEKQDKRSDRVILRNSSNSSNFQLQSLSERDLLLIALLLMSIKVSVCIMEIVEATLKSS